MQFAYPETPDKRVMNIPRWNVSAGEKIFVHGPSGCGKSTLLNVLCGMLAASSGEVSILGERLDQMSPRQRDHFRARHIGYVFQQFNLITYLSAKENIQLAQYFGKHGKANSQKETERLLTNLNIHPDDWNKQINKLSIGQQQRIAIARALINKPELVIADEPTSSLDKENRDNFMSMLLSLVTDNNSTLVFVSHDLSLSKHFDRVDALSEFNKLKGTR